MIDRWFSRTRGFSIWHVMAMLMVGLLSACGGGGGDTAAPAAPTKLVAVGGDGQATLSWVGSAGASSYNIYWSTSTGVTTASGTKIAGVASPYVHVGLTNGSTYYYIVTAVGTGGESAASSEASTTLAPGAPGTVSAVSGDQTVTVDWRNVFTATSYNLYWSTAPGVTKTTGTKIANVVAPYAHTGLTNGTTYYYVVTSVSNLGESVESEQVSAVPQVPAPGAPQNVSAILTPETTKSVTLQWTPPSTPATILSYNLYRSTTPGVAANLGLATKTTGVVSPHIDLVPAGQVTYYYVLTAVSAGGEGAPSAEVSATPRGAPGGAGGGGAGGGGGGEKAFGNNLSVPLVFANGVGVLGGVITGTDYTDLATGLRPTATDVTNPFPYFNVADAYTLNLVDYYRQQTSSTWQASWINGKTAPQDVELDWGDNLTSAALSPNQVIRVETVLRQYKGGTSWPDTVSMSGYPMQLLYGQGATEMQGTTGITSDATERRVYTVNAHLTIQKLVNGVPSNHTCGFDGSIADGLALADGGQQAKYSAEINVGGSLTYGFNWRLNQCTAGDKAGTWRITFRLDDRVTVGNLPYDNNTFIRTLHPSETAATKLDGPQTSTIDVTIN
jgi:fibronectin type 3 domain-containing protein